MARAWAGTRVVLACTVFSVLCLAAGPAHAGAGDLVDSAGAVGGVTDSTESVLNDTVRKVTRAAGSPSPQEPPSGPRDDVSQLSEAAAELVRDVPRVLDPEPQNGRTSPAPDTSSDIVSNAPRRRDKAHGGRPARERTSAVARAPRRSSAYDDSMHRPRLAVRGRHATAAPAPYVHPCESGSLAARDLLRCARAGMSLPGLGGFPMILPPAGLVMVVLGLVLVACGRRRGTCVEPAV